MATQILCSRSRYSVRSIVAALILMSASLLGQAPPPSKTDKMPDSSTAQIDKWTHDVSGAMEFLHELFPDINPKAKSIIENQRDWQQSGRGVGSFTVYVCEPDRPDHNRKLKSDFFTR